MAQPRPWTSRQLDLLYYIFFLIHIPASLLCDLQGFYPSWLTSPPSPLHTIQSFYLEMSRDPIVSGALGLNGDLSNWTWIRTFFVVEAVFQVPAFFVGVYGLYKDTPKIYPLLLVYATTAVIQTLPCLVYVYRMPLIEDNASSSTPLELFSQDSATGIAPVIASLTQAQFVVLMMCYVPFMLVPSIMMVDMAFRVQKLVRKGVDVENKAGLKKD